MRIFLATWMEDNQGTTLTSIGVRDRLMSYYFLMGAPTGFLSQYIESGYVQKKKRMEDFDAGKQK